MLISHFLGPALSLYSFIPYVGSLISGVAAGYFAVIQYGSWPFIWIIGSVIIIHAIIGNYIEPKVMGKSLNLSPLVVLLSLVFGALSGILLGDVGGAHHLHPVNYPGSVPVYRALAILLTENGDIEKPGRHDQSPCA